MKKHLVTLKRGCKHGSDGKSLLASFPAALQKKPSDRNESDAEIIKQLGEALDQRIASFDEQLDKASLAAEADRQQLETILSDVTKCVESESEARESKGYEANSEKKNLVEWKDNVYKKLQAYDWETSGQLRSLNVGLKKLFKHLEIDKSTAESLTR